MSKNLPEPNNSEEVDLGQLFKLIGNAFERFFKFFGRIFYSLFLAFVWLVFFFKKHVIIIVVAAVLGLVVGFVKEKFSNPIYQSSVIVKQNYNTGKNLYNLISYYNELIDARDKSTVAEALGVTMDVANELVSIEIEPIITENQMVKNYDYYKRGLDSVLGSIFSYESYVENTDPTEFVEQQIKIKAKHNFNTTLIFNNIVNNINQTEYFKRENEKDLLELNNRELALKQALIKSDSLQKMYKRVLEMSKEDTKGSQTSITIEGSDQIDKTKEFELYKSEIEIRRELVEIERNKQDRSQILEIITSSQERGVVSKDIEIFGITVGLTQFFMLLFVSITILVLMGLQFLKYLERFKEEI
ncbi:hypothetical protein ACFO5O_11065 [Geojedonia litorea]|uniref:Chain length determinant protein n=1 Tax=Geojedonia litorea TaxID=1268269 RepID=A0ABV9N5V0_9FLAO